MKSIELWGGYECTVNRVGHEWFDQTPRSGHEERIDDLQLFADLGVRSLRYPALWERISPQAPASRDFRWTDERLPEIRRLGMNPILTLCHHGSGPHYTSLIEDSFAPGLADHAAAVAARYPWVRDWTPVNENLTTARFSALYGYWYPHTKDERLFWVALLNEIDATRLAMREIRRINPEARLIQTDDLGYCHATPPLQCDADFQNERRWVGWDLLCGTVVPGHALWDHIASFGLDDRLRVIADDPCPPGIIGINHYLSSERLRDHRVELYPHRSLADRETGKCSGLEFVDVDAIRNRKEGVLGLPALLRQAWDRYGLPMAVTECHNGATREEQVRWFVEVWQGVAELRNAGVDICAVTAWSLLGSHDWNRMVTRFIGHYETGVYDCRTGTPRATLMEPVLRQLATGEMPDLPFLRSPGWWHRSSRFIDAIPGSEASFEVEIGSPGVSPLMIVGDNGPLTRLAVRACEVRGLQYVRCGQEGGELVNAAQPWAVLDVRDGSGASELVEACARHGVRCAVVASLTSRHQAPQADNLLLVRTGAVYAPWDRSTRAVRILDALDSGRSIEVDASRLWDRVYGPDLIDGVLDLLLDEVTGEIWFVPAERLSEAEFARALAEVADRDAGLIEEVGSPAGPPLFAFSGEASYLPPGETTLERFVRECRAARCEGDLAVHRREDEVRLEAAE
ncbi:MAG TPA: dTDP-4-dehydrorhamnose reductase [Allosphingosinicella sp.]|jgi:dTDP-4-dehydrorhamnose reductase